MNLYRKNGKRRAWVQARLTELRHQAHHNTYCFGATVNPQEYQRARQSCAAEYAVLRGWTTFHQLEAKGLYQR